MRVEGDYDRDGAVCVRGAFSLDEIDLARAAIDANLASLSHLAQRASPDNDAFFIEDYCSWRRIPEMAKFIRSISAASIESELMG